MSGHFKIVIVISKRAECNGTIINGIKKIQCVQGRSEWRIVMARKFFLVLVCALFAFGLSISATAAPPRNDDNSNTVTVQEGTTLRVSLDSTLSTRSARPGDQFTATLREPIYVNGKEAIPYGTRIEGRVSQVERPGRVHGVGKLDIAFERISLPNGYSETIVASAVGTEGASGTKVGKEGTVSGPSSRKRDVEETAAGGGIGAGIGAIAGGAKGTAIGAGVGVIIGLADSMRRRGKDLELAAGTTLIMRLDRPLNLQINSNR